jgi:hypothetical protein
MTHPNERRRAPRALADFPIQLSPQGSTAPARLKDLSAIGLCCTTASPIDEMVLVGIDLQLPGSNEKHHVQGAVVRCDPADGEEGAFEIAVYFTAIEEDTKQALQAYVAQGAPA